MKRIFLLVLMCVMLAACSVLTEQPAALTSTATIATTASLTPAPSRTTLPTDTATPTLTVIPTTTPLPSAPVFSLYIDNLVTNQRGGLYASGFNQEDNLRHFAVWGKDGWSELGMGFSTAGNSLAVDSAGRLYTEIITDTVACMAIMQWDGAAWQDITGNFTEVVDALQPGRVSCNIPVVALAVDGGDQLYAAGSYYYPNADNTQEIPMGYVAKWNEGSWSVLGQGFEGVNIHALAVSAAENIYASGEQPSKWVGELPISGFIAHWDGEKWSPMDTDRPDQCTSVVQLASDSSGGVYAACTPNGPGELISHWDGTAWTTITDRLEGEAPVIYDMAADENGGLYIGGDFEAVGGMAVRDIAYWDGSAWHALGDGVNERVQALTFDPSRELYAAGWFTVAGGVPVDHLARWDGETWQALVP